MKKICLTSLTVVLATGLLLAQKIPLARAKEAGPASDANPGVKEKDENASYVIFSNLGSSGDLYNSVAFNSKPIIGRHVEDKPVTWQAVRFVPEVDVQATVLEAAIGYSSGTRSVTLALYDDDPSYHYPGKVLPGGEGSTTQVPNLGDCCDLTKVTLRGKGVTLTAGTIYWLVGKNTKGTDFTGGWQVSHFGESADYGPPDNPWAPLPSEWLAARISGKLTQDTKREFLPEGAASSEDGSSDNVTFFSNINPAFSQPYIPGIGRIIAGDKAQGYSEIWWALPFTPNTSGRVITLSAAIGYYGGSAKEVILALYTDTHGLPGKVLPNGQARTSNIPDAGDCCDFATVQLPGKGVAVSKGVQYWLVASPDDLNAPDFEGLWQISTDNIVSQMVYRPPDWQDFNGDWMAAKITGTGD